MVGRFLTLVVEHCLNQLLQTDKLEAPSVSFPMIQSVLKEIPK